MSMGFTSADLGKLKEALVSGAESIQIGDRTVNWRSQDELIALITMIQNELTPPTADAPNTKNIKAKFSRGGS